MGNELCYGRRFLGRMETGRDTVSDPAMASGVPGLWGREKEHPNVPDDFRMMKRQVAALSRKPTLDKDARFYDEGHPFIEL